MVIHLFLCYGLCGRQAPAARGRCPPAPPVGIILLFLTPTVSSAFAGACALHPQQEGLPSCTSRWVPNAPRPPVIQVYWQANVIAAMPPPRHGGG
jgi:hypothetical protein